MQIINIYHTMNFVEGMAIPLIGLRNRALWFVMSWYTKGTDMPTKPEGLRPEGLVELSVPEV